MSMHEFENVVEESIRVLDRSKSKELDFRSLFYTLYDFQSWWDTGFTGFRVVDILLNRRYTYRFSLKDHPGYEKHKLYFESIKDKDFEDIYLKPEEKDFEENIWAGYYRAPYLYCDAGSPLWEEMVKFGKLKGEDSIPPQKLDIIETIKTVLIEAQKQSNLEMLQLWYPLFGAAISFLDEKVLTSLTENPSVILMRSIIEGVQAFDAKTKYGMPMLPTLEVIENKFQEWE